MNTRYLFSVVLIGFGIAVGCETKDDDAFGSSGDDSGYEHDSGATSASLMPLDGFTFTG